MGIPSSNLWWDLRRRKSNGSVLLLKDFRSFSQPQHYDFEPTDLRKMIDEVIAEDKTAL